MTTTATISRFRGDTKRIVKRVVDAGKNPVDITGWSALLTVNSEENPADATNQVEQITGTILGAATDGRFSFVPSGTADVVGTAYYDIQVTDNNAEVHTMEKGEWIVEQDITK